MPQPGDYTIGWICAIQPEHVAARVFLDEEHAGPTTQPSHDSNTYTLGEISGHNVVIAVLPHGQYGISSATSIVKDMMHTFPNIRIGLMVGIGGGAPSKKHDIRLGDVVVSIPRGTRGGVFQYDFGKTIQDQKFRTTGALNQPPNVLLTATTVISSQYESDGHNLEKDIRDVLQKKPKLRKKYSRPKPESDKLFKSGIVHPENNEASCEAVCDGPEKLIVRPERAEDEDNPAIHYGLIASANQLMKDALVRDKLAEEEGILCFEMEAAGLMNHFPCLVIRGICDYSDSHKNEEWQGYAAMVAAAYTKDILRRIVPSRVEAETKLSDMLSGLYQVATKQLEITREYTQAQKDLAKKMLTQEEEKCLQQFRLTSSDRNITYEWYKGRVEERVEGTCLWFLQHHHFQRWLKQDSGPLLVTADPGCGKSVFAKYLIDHGLPRSVTTCYFFFKDQDQNTVQQTLCALLHQLLVQKPSLIRHAIPYYNKDGSGLINTTESLWKILQNAIMDPETGSVILVLDALDECPESDFADLVRNIEIQCCSKDIGYSKLKYLLTCRPYSQMISKFQDLLRAFPNLHIPGEEESGKISQEVNHVITYRVNQLSNNLSPQIKRHLEQSLQKTTHRTYLWVYLVFEKLKTEDFKKTQRGIESAIEKLPRSVNEAYEQILKRSDDEEYLMARRVLSIILASSRSLSIAELNIATNIDHATKSLDDLDLENEDDFKQRIRSWCGLFISIHQGHVYFLHQTAREFLLVNSASSTTLSNPQWYQSIALQDAQAILAELNVRYLDLFNSDISLEEDITQEADNQIDKFPFLQYSAQNWGAHFREGNIMGGAAIIPFTLGICDPGSKSFSVWFQIYWKKTGHATTDHFTDLMLASHNGHCIIVELLLEKGANLESKDTHFSSTPLIWAVRNGNKAISKLLIEKGANLESKDQDGQMPLIWAVRNRNQAIAKLLIEKGANLESKDYNGKTPLIWAAQNGNEAIAKLLIEKGANVDVKDIHNSWTPLLWASRNGNKAIAKLLIEKGANVDVKDIQNSWTPLIWAARNAGQAIAKLLIEKGANLESEDQYGRTPLLWAIQNGNEAIAKLLIEKGAKLQSKDQYSQMPLIWAIQNGNQAIAKLLIEKGTNLEYKDQDGRTPLARAAFLKKEAIVKLLIEKGANLESKDQYGRTPLAEAALMERDALAKLLIEKGANLESKDQDSQTPLAKAALMGRDATAKLLIEKGANLESKDQYGRTPLSVAASNGEEAIVKLLIEKGANLESEDQYGRTPLVSAAWNGHETIVKLVLKTPNVDANSKDNCGRTALMWAARSGIDAMVMALISIKTVDIDVKDYYGLTPLSIATRHNQIRITKRLLDTGRVDWNSRDHFGRSPLWYARRYGYHSLTQLLLKYAEKSDGAICERAKRRIPLDVASRPVWTSSIGRECDVCTLYVRDGHGYYHCTACNAGDFYVCSGCHKLGAHCLDVDHKLA